MSRIVVDALKKLPERQRFMKGLFGWVGFKTISIDYVREKRRTGSSKFTGGRLWNFALEGITSSSTLPLRIWSYVGLLGAVAATLYGSFILLRTIIYGIDTPGYASVLIAIIFFGSLQLIGLGMLGEYVGRIYMEAKQRPKYLIRNLYQKK
jgi:glycosyltransferase involved in cell wall biosynthesis